jgi:hypothetical protein
VAKIRNVSGNDLVVPSLGGRLVLAGQIVDVDDDAVYGFTQQAPNWEPADDATQALHDAEAPVAEEPADPPAAALTPVEARATGDLPPSTTDVVAATDTTPEG